MATKALSNEFMAEVLEGAAWEALSKELAWSEQLLDKYRDKVDWRKVSENVYILWTTSMLQNFKKRIDWKELSFTLCESILCPNVIDQFKECWDWSVLSGNRRLKLTYSIIDRFIDSWDWKVLIDRYRDEEIYTIEFLEKYIDKIPASELQQSDLWNRIVQNRMKELMIEILQ